MHYISFTHAIHICSCRAYEEGEARLFVKAFGQWNEIFAPQSERANGANIPSHACLVLVLALFFEFSLGFYGLIPLALYMLGPKP